MKGCMVSKNPRRGDPLIQRTDQGLYCPQGDVYIDPWRPVPRALITHAHADHARPGSSQYHCAADSAGVIASRLNTEHITTHQYGHSFQLNDIEVTFFPAGHILGSAQIRLSDGEQTWVITGDYKRTPDPTCQVFEPVECDVLITEATFALPIYRWPSMDDIMPRIFRWWDANVRAKRTPVLLCYSLGKAQRVMAEIASRSNRSVRVHGAVATLNAKYEDAQVTLCPWERASDAPKGVSQELVIAPPQVAGSAFLKRFGPTELAMASGWMQVRGVRRRAAINQGFVISDHADWDELLATIHQSKAHTVYATHGETRVLTRFLNETTAINATRLETAFGIHQEGDQ
jgi:putative mRNA 3-end processing factor